MIQRRPALRRRSGECVCASMINASSPGAVVRFRWRSGAVSLPAGRAAVVSAGEEIRLRRRSVARARGSRFPAELTCRLYSEVAHGLACAIWRPGRSAPCVMAMFSRSANRRGMYRGSTARGARRRIGHRLAHAARFCGSHAGRMGALHTLRARSITKEQFTVTDEADRMGARLNRTEARAR
jgi:hypothetical protein